MSSSLPLSLLNSPDPSLTPSLLPSLPHSGPACTYSSNSSIDGVTIGSVRDLANTSLRRKLFAQPSRITEEEEEEEEGREDMAVERTDCGSPQIPTDCITPLKLANTANPLQNC